jgi:hypothetical protein
MWWESQLKWFKKNVYVLTVILAANQSGKTYEVGHSNPRDGNSKVKSSAIPVLCRGSAVVISLAEQN